MTELVTGATLVTSLIILVIEGVKAFFDVKRSTCLTCDQSTHTHNVTNTSTEEYHSGSRVVKSEDADSHPSHSARKGSEIRRRHH